MRFRNNQPMIPAAVDAVRMPTFADINEGPEAKASPPINSDMVNPIPARLPAAQKWYQVTPSGQHDNTSSDDEPG
jgi:hypothetical protein